MSHQHGSYISETLTRSSIHSYTHILVVIQKPVDIQENSDEKQFCILKKLNNNIWHT